MVIAKSKKFQPRKDSTIKNMDYTWSPGPEQPKKQEAGVPRAIFVPHANSLPFEERRVTLEEPVKIGRNVYRTTPSPTNTIFECRVLSRHHATLFYDKGHFYLVDNQSSNGTFINNNQCSISKEKEPHQVFSGDVVQFGISVVDNVANSEKNTFPPVVALLKLFHPDGSEAKLSFSPTMTAPLPLRELYQLNTFVQEALQREASLESRLRTLRECVERTRGEANTAWRLFIGEQRLLMRVHTLEGALAAGRQPDHAQLAQLLDDKRNYQEVAQESLRSAHEQRLALEESLERRSREAAALQTHNCALRLAANNSLAELQKLAARCERKMCAARLAIAAAEEREAAVRARLPIAYSVQNGEAKLLVLSTDSNRVLEEGRRGQHATLEDAVRALPDYVKMLLPQQLLAKVGIKTISTEGKTAKEFELILKKNNMYEPEKRERSEKQQEHVVGDGVGDGDGDGEGGDCGEGEGGEEKSATELRAPDTSTDDEKRARANHDLTIEVEDSNSLDSNALDVNLRPDNNANSTFAADLPDTDDSPSKGHLEYANVLRVMSGLNEEIRALRERLAAASSEVEQLRGVRDELLSAQTDARDEPPATEPEDAAAMRARIADLQAQLTRSTVAEEANLAEIQRLAATAAEMQAELAFRPTRLDVDDLAALVAQLRYELSERDHQLQRQRSPPCTADKCTHTEPNEEPPASGLSNGAPDRNISDEIDEMFKLDFEEDEEEASDSPDTEILSERVEPPDLDDRLQETRIDDEARLQVTLHNGSLHALEEELVRVKESWAEVCAERANLAAQVASLQCKPQRLQPGYLVAYALPMLAVCLYWLLLPYIS